VTVSVLVPVSDLGPSLREHLCACLRAVADLGVEVVVFDNMSIDGCCRHLPREVLIVRTERVESPVQLWRLGCSLANAGSVLWLPELLFCPPEQFRTFALAAIELAAREAKPPSAVNSKRTRFTAAGGRAVVITPLARSSLDRWRRIPGLGFVLFAFAACRLLLVTALETGGDQADSPPAGPETTYAPFPVSNATSSPPLASVKPASKPLSVIITAHNEGIEVVRTIESIRANTLLDHEIIVVDDGSTDGSCSELEAIGVRVVRHPERVGVAYSRNAGSRAALGEAYAYLDAHQRVERGSLDRCAELATAYQAIACPPCRPLNERYPVSYGASFRLCSERGYFSARYRFKRPRQEITRITALRSPAYVIPRTVYERVAWIAGLRGWGATDLGLAVKAFFTDVDILYIHTGATQHLFRKSFPYEASSQSIWRNHALIARVCFDERTWSRYWLPEVFHSNLIDEVRRELDSPAVLAEREAFRAVKVRPDREFWRGLLRIKEPKALN
jgi:glycosyltransferase involved in cell wall biosynthesis